MHSIICFQIIYLDTSHFFWLITYFLKFTAQLELDLEQVKSVLSYDIISYLTFETVSLCEEMELLMSHDGDNVLLQPCLRRMHLVRCVFEYQYKLFLTYINAQVITSIKEYINTLDSFKRISHLSAVSWNHHT